MALSTLAQLKHRQLLYGVSTRLSQENIKDMMYLAGVEQQLQESISSGTDFFTILEQKGLLGQHNYTHLISLLETIGRIDLIKTVCSDHQATAVVALPPDKFPVAEQLAVMKRAQILQKRELYTHSMQKLDTLHKSTTILQQMMEPHMMNMLSILQISESDSVGTSPKCFDITIVGDLLRSVSLFSRSLRYLLLAGENREFECLAMLCHQHCDEFSAKMPKDCVPVIDSLQQVHSLEYTKDSLIGQTAVQIHQSLHDLFSELLGSQNLLTVVDTSFNKVLVNGQSYFNVKNYILPMAKWSILLLQAIEQGHVNGENLQDTVLIDAINRRHILVENGDEITKIVGQDLYDKVIQLIPQTNQVGQQSTKVPIPGMYKDFYGLFAGT